jgi:putative phosphoesterase
VIDGLTIYATHGHIYNKEHLLPMQKGDILLHGHTHILTAETFGDITILNPGSVSIPKGGNPPTYALLEDRIFRIMDFDGNIIKEMNLGE